MNKTKMDPEGQQKFIGYNKGSRKIYGCLLEIRRW